MGHAITGPLPKSRKWRDVVLLLNNDPGAQVSVASATTIAAEQRLRDLRGDPSLIYCFWLLTRLASAARGDDFAGDVARLGIAVKPQDGVVQFIARVNERVRIEIERNPDSGVFGEMASLALISALTRTIGLEGRSLFGSSQEDLERAFRRHSHARQFGELSQRFFGDFIARTLRFYVDRALMSSVGPRGFANGIEAGAFADALGLHAYETAAIVDVFAQDWHYKHHRAQDGWIGQDETGRFVAHALSKLRGELKRGDA